MRSSVIPRNKIMPVVATTSSFECNSFKSQLMLYTQRQFTGRLDLQISPQHKWSLYLNLGRLVWATGGIHQTRRWHRLMSRYCPQLSFDQITLRHTDKFECWDYHLLTILVKRQIISLEKTLKVTRKAIAEVLFDIVQKIETASLGSSMVKNERTLAVSPVDPPGGIPLKKFQMKHKLGVRPSNQGILPPNCLLPTDSLLKQVHSKWEKWVEAGLTYCSPNLAPKIKQKLQLQEKTTASVYQNLVTLVNGQRTLRDLSYLMKQDLLYLTKSLAPYVRKQLIGLVKIPDLTRPNFIYSANTPGNFFCPSAQKSRESLIACIDDNSDFCLTMEELIHNAGYRPLTIKDALQALPMLLQHNPDFVFLDLVMPIASGYEICAQIRRIARFQATPIVIISSNDGIMERLRARMVGATDFLSKPIEERKVLEVLHKYHYNQC